MATLVVGRVCDQVVGARAVVFLPLPPAHLTHLND